MIEVLIALSILVMCVTGTVGLLRWVVRGTDFSTRMSGATLAAETKLENLSKHPTVTEGSTSTNGFNLVWSVTSSGTIRYLTVRASFTGMDGGSHGVTLDQILSD